REALMPSPRWIHSSIPPRIARFLAVLGVAACRGRAMTARADDAGWPRQFDSPSGSFVIYQPQPEHLDGDVLTGRAAFSLQKSEEQNLVYGVLWYTEHIEVDRDSSVVTARNLDVTKVRLPGITPGEADRYEQMVETQAAGWDLSGSVEELQVGLAAAEQERGSNDALDTVPPKILVQPPRPSHV